MEIFLILGYYNSRRRNSKHYSFCFLGTFIPKKQQKICFPEGPSSVQESLDDLHNITSWMALRPGYFVSTTGDVYTYELHFRSTPTFVEVYDIHGDGIRADLATSTTTSTTTATAAELDPENSSTNQPVSFANHGRCLAAALVGMSLTL